jgi:hypothetical protein
VLSIGPVTPEERSNALRRQADEVLDRIHLRGQCAGIGDIISTGSYFLDLIMYPDIDLYLPPTTRIVEFLRRQLDQRRIRPTLGLREIFTVI